VTSFGPYFPFHRKAGDELNERQKQVIGYLKTNFKITPKDYMKLFKVSDKTARNDLKDIEKKDYIIFTGSKKTGYYQLKLPNKLPNKVTKGDKDK